MEIIPTGDKVDFVMDYAFNLFVCLNFLQRNESTNGWNQKDQLRILSSKPTFDNRKTYYIYLSLGFLINKMLSGCDHTLKCFIPFIKSSFAEFTLKNKSPPCLCFHFIAPYVCNRNEINTR